MSDAPRIQMLPLNSCGDDRGSLIAIEANDTIPFEIKRVYYLFDTRTDVSRGFHAHKALKQVAVAVKGSCTMVLDNGRARASIVLDRPDKGLVIEEFVWREMHDFSPDCVLLVLASEHYDNADYIRDYNVFLEMVGS